MEVLAFSYGEFKKVIDFTDYRILEKYESDLQDYMDRLKAATDSSKSYAAQMRGMFDTVVFMLESTLGEGSSNKILGDTTSLNEAMNAFKALVSYREQQDTQTVESWKDTANKYSPKARTIAKKPPKKS